jgi:hypothetical protein
MFFYGFADEVCKLAGAIPGGLAEGMPDSAFDKKQLRMGIRVEKEHTPSAAKAKEIAQDHLTEQIQEGKKQDYYTKLMKMEGGHSKKANGEEGEATGKMPKNINQVLRAFFKAHPKPTDDQVHELAEAHNVSPHALESRIYAMLGKRIKTAASRYEMESRGDRGGRYTSGKAVRSRRKPSWGKNLTAKERFVLSRTMAKKAEDDEEDKKKKKKSFIRKAGPGLGALAGLGVSLATKRPLLTGVGAGATVGWLPDISASLVEAIKERRNGKAD